MSGPITLVLFDMDDVLCDHHPAWMDPLAAVTGDRGVRDAGLHARHGLLRLEV